MNIDKAKKEIAKMKADKKKKYKENPKLLEIKRQMFAEQDAKIKAHQADYKKNKKRTSLEDFE